MTAMLPSVLVVDDDESTRRLMSRALRQEFRVETAVGARDALARTKHESFAAVLVDLHLPDGNGVWLLEQLLGTCPSTRRVLMSGDDSGIQVASRLAEAFLMKPVQLQGVLECLRRLTRRRARS